VGKETIYNVDSVCFAEHIVQFCYCVYAFFGVGLTPEKFNSGSISDTEEACMDIKLHG